MTVPTQTPGSPLLETGPPVCKPWCGKGGSCYDNHPGATCLAGGAPRFNDPCLCSVACRAAGRPLRPPAASPVAGMPAPDERIYPCDDCGVMRSKAEGGTVFAVCHVCWDKRYQPAPQRSRVEEMAEEYRADWGMVPPFVVPFGNRVLREFCDELLQSWVDSAKGWSEELEDAKSRWLSGDAPGGGR